MLRKAREAIVAAALAGPPPDAGRHARGRTTVVLASRHADESRALGNQEAIAAALHDAEVNTEGCGILRQGLIPDKLLAENPPTTLTPPTPLAPPATAVLAISATAVHPSLAEATFREVAGHTLHLPSVCFGRTLEEAS